MTSVASTKNDVALTMRAPRDTHLPASQVGVGAAHGHSLTGGAPPPPLAPPTPPVGEPALLPGSPAAPPSSVDTPPLPPCALMAFAVTVWSPVPCDPMFAHEPDWAGLQVDAVPVAVPPVRLIVPVVETVCVPVTLLIVALLPAVVPPRIVIEA